MAFKAIDLKETAAYVSADDPAIDHVKSDIEKYKKDRDLGDLVFLENEAPTIFELGNVPDRSFSAIQDKHMSVNAGPAEDIKVAPFGMARDFVRIGLRGVKNAEGFDLKFAGGAAPQLVAESSMNQLRAWGVVDEIGNVIMQMNGANSEDEKKPGPQ